MAQHNNISLQISQETLRLLNEAKAISGEPKARIAERGIWTEASNIIAEYQDSL